LAADQVKLTLGDVNAPGEGAVSAARVLAVKVHLWFEAARGFAFICDDF
jgi:hypothetical protein